VSEPRLRALPAALLAAVFVVVPLALLAAGSGYFFRLAVVTLIFSILALSMQLITGVAGLLSLGHAAIYGVGAYTAAILSTRLGLDAALTIPLSGLVSGLLGIALALPTMRLVSIYFAVATLGLGEMIYVTLLNWVSFTKGPLGIGGIPPLRPLGIDLSDPLGTYLAVAAAAGFAAVVVHRCAHSYWGNALRAVREDDQCADAMGLNVVRLKIEVFAIACFLAGIAGALWAHTTGYVNPADFRFAESILILAMVVVGGLGSVPGAVIGAALLLLLPEALRAVGEVRILMVGVVMFLCILFLPKGLFGEVSALALARRQLGAAWQPGRGLGWR
jgi:branched-chain amino acid transport system permease protein